MKTVSTLLCLMVLAVCLTFLTANEPEKDIWEEKLPPIFSGTFEGSMNNTERKNDTGMIVETSKPAFMTFINNLVLFETVNSSFIGTVRVNAAKKRLVLIGAENRNEEQRQPQDPDQPVNPNPMDNKQVSHVAQMCIYSTTGPNHFKMACGMDQHKRPIFPLSFNDTKVIGAVLSMHQNMMENTIPKEMEGLYYGDHTRNGTMGNLIIRLGNSHLTVVEKPHDREFNLFHCRVTFNTTAKPERMTCNRKIFNPNKPETARQEMIYKFNNTNPAGKMLEVAFGDDGKPAPMDFQFAKSNIRAWSQRAPLELQGRWFGRIKDFQTGASDTPVEVEFRNNTMLMSTQFSRFFGVYRTAPTQKMESELRVFSVESANASPEKPFSNLKVGTGLLMYEVKNVLNNRKLLKICFKDNGSEKPKGPEAPFSCGDHGVTVVELSNVKMEKFPVEVFGFSPQFGVAGKQVTLNVKFSLPQSNRRAFGNCPGNLKILLGDNAASDVTCELGRDGKGAQVRFTVPQSTKLGPHRISLEYGGFSIHTPFVFSYVPTDVSSAVSVPQISPNRVPLNGAMINLPVRNVDNLAGQTIMVNVNDQACANVTAHGNVIRCVAPAQTAPGEYFVTVQIGSVFALVTAKILYNSANNDIVLGPATPGVVSLDGGQKITLPVFVKNGDGTTPSDLFASVTIAGMDCTNLVGPTATDNPKMYLVKCDVPSAATAGRADVLFTATTQGDTFVAKSHIVYANSDAAKNIVIFNVNPKHGPAAGGFNIDISCKVPLSTFVSTKRLITEEDTTGVSVTLGGLPCPISEVKFDKTKGIGKIVCKAPGFTAGTYPVQLSFPGGMSISKARFTFTSETQPKISKISPARVSSTEAATYNITGSNFGPPPSKRSFFSRAVTATDCSTVSVSLGDKPCSNVQCLSGTDISAYCPPAVSGGESSIVVNVNGESSPSDSSVEGSVSVEVSSTTQPSISSVTPNKADAAGGTEITVSGTNFGSSSTDLSFTVGGNICSEISDVSDTSFKCKTPPGTAGAANVVASRGGESSFTMSDKFEFTGNIDDPTDPTDPTGAASSARIAVGAIVVAACMFVFM